MPKIEEAPGWKFVSVREQDASESGGGARLTPFPGTHLPTATD